MWLLTLKLHNRQYLSLSFNYSFTNLLEICQTNKTYTKSTTTEFGYLISLLDKYQVQIEG